MEEKFIHVDGYRIRYLQDGDPSCDTIVLLHGLGASAERWARVMPLFSERFRVVVPDMIGFGQSDKPQTDYTPDFLSSFLEKFVRATCQRRISLIGSSLGGQITAMYAAIHQASVRKLVLVSPAGTMNRPTPALDLYIMAALYPNVQSVSHAFETMEGPGGKAGKELVSGFIKRMKLPNAKLAFMSTMLGLKNSMLSESTLRSITHPTLIVWGDNDPVIPIRNAGYFVSAIKDCTFFRMDNCGHTPYVQHPETFADRVIKFLR